MVYLETWESFWSKLYVYVALAPIFIVEIVLLASFELFTSAINACLMYDHESIIYSFAIMFNLFCF